MCVKTIETWMQFPTTSILTNPLRSLNQALTLLTVLISTLSSSSVNISALAFLTWIERVKASLQSLLLNYPCQILTIFPSQGFG